jgi:hypothetical protein
VIDRVSGKRQIQEQILRCGPSAPQLVVVARNLRWHEMGV